MSETTQEEFDRWWATASDYRDALLEAAQSAPGYAGAEVRFASRELVIFAVGAPSAELAVLIDRGPVGFHILWAQAPYTHAELMAEVDLLMRANEGRLVSGGAHHDGTRLDFTTTDPELLAAEDPQGMLGSRYPVSTELRRAACPVLSSPPGSRQIIASSSSSVRDSTCALNSARSS